MKIKSINNSDSDDDNFGFPEDKIKTSPIKQKTSEDSDDDFGDFVSVPKTNNTDNKNEENNFFEQTNDQPKY